MPTHLVRIEQLYDVKQPIKIEKPLQWLLTFSYNIGERKILPFFFFSFYFLNAQGDNYSSTVYVLGHKYIVGSFQSSF